MPTAQAFRAAIGRAAADDTVRAVLLTGAGKRFCAGGDVAAFASFESAEDQRDYLVGLAHELDAANQELAALEKPVVAHVQGAVAGAGLSVMLSCRSEEHTSELQSLMRISYAVFCLKKKNNNQ